MNQSARRRILAYLEARIMGATDEEIALDLGIPSNTSRPRRSDLVRSGRVKDSGRTRKTEAGGVAIVWIACDEPPLKTTTKARKLLAALEPFVVKAKDQLERHPEARDGSLVNIRVTLGACHALIEALKD